MYLISIFGRNTRVTSYFAGILVKNCFFFVFRCAVLGNIVDFIRGSSTHVFCIPGSVSDFHPSAEVDNQFGIENSSSVSQLQLLNLKYPL